jgi:hypothetical protein
LVDVFLLIDHQNLSPKKCESFSTVLNNPIGLLRDTLYVPRGHRQVDMTQKSLDRKQITRSGSQRSGGPSQRVETSTLRDLHSGLLQESCEHGTHGMIETKSSGYKPLVDETVRFFKTGKVPVSAEETIEIYAFMSAADVSRAQGGAAVSLEELIQKTRRQNEEPRLQKTRRK